MTVRLGAVVLILLAAAVPVAHADALPAGWRDATPPGWGYGVRLSADAATPGRVYASIPDGDAVSRLAPRYARAARSDDGGRTWVSVGRVRAVVADGRVAGRAYAFSLRGKRLVSTDAGRSWRVVRRLDVRGRPLRAGFRGVVPWGAAPGLAAWGPAGLWTSTDGVRFRRALAGEVATVDPVPGRPGSLLARLHAASIPDDGAHVLVATDGRHAVTRTRRLQVCEGDMPMLVDPADPLRLLCGEGRSEDGGRTWHPLHGLVVGIDPVARRALLVSPPRFVLVSQALGGGLLRPEGAGLEPWLVTAQAARVGGELLLASEGALFRRADGDPRWATVGGPPGAVAEDATWSDGQLLVPTGDGSIRRSADAGRTWSALVRQGFARHVAVGGGSPATLIATGKDEFQIGQDAFRSADGGASWKGPLPIGGPAAFAPDVPGRVYAGSFRPIHPDEDIPVLARSDDDGRTWRVVGDLPEFEEALQVAIGAGPAPAVWVVRNTGTGADSPDAFGLSVLRPGARGLATVDPLPGADAQVGFPVPVAGHPDAAVVAAGSWPPGGGLYRTDDAGRTWRRILALPAEISPPVLAGAWPRLAVVLQTPDANEARVSGDGGATWTPLPAPSQEVVALAVEPPPGTGIAAVLADGRLLVHDG